MNLNFCHLTGLGATQPTASKKTGHVYEGPVIQKYIKLNGKCPVTGEPMTLDDIIPLKFSAPVDRKRGPPEEGKVAERKRLKVELSVREQLTQWSKEFEKTISSMEAPLTLATPDQVKNYTMVDYLPPHLKELGDSTHSIDWHYSKDFLAFGRIDGSVGIFHSSSRSSLELFGHAGKVTAVKFLQANVSPLITGSADKTVKIWRAAENGIYEMTKTFKDHTAEVVAVCIHPNKQHFLSVSLDGLWCLNDLQTASHIYKHSGGINMRAADLSPNGCMLGVGTSEAFARIYDVRSKSKIFDLGGHTGEVNSLSFSADGKFIATAAQDGVKLWDLRKRPFQLFSYFNEVTPIRTVEFDHTGRYLAVGGSAVRVYDMCDMPSGDFLYHLEVNAAIVKFGPDAKWLAVKSTGKNNDLQIFKC